MAKPNHTLEELKGALHYDPETGEFTWARFCSPRAVAGSRAGAVYQNGYRMICFQRKDYPAHRLAWAFVHGVWPSANIDHINGNRTDNRISNLRDVPQTMNSQNQRRPHKDKTSCQLIGATWDKMWKNWKAQVRLNGKTIYLGRFATAEEAHAAYLEGKRRLHPGCTI